MKIVSKIIRSQSKNFIKDACFVFLIMLCANISSYAATSIKIQDTTIQRGEIIKIPVLCSLDNYSDISKLSLDFSFDKYLLSLKYVETNAHTVLQCKNYMPKINFSTTPASFSINCIDFNESKTDTLCFLNFEALVAPDSICRIVPSNLIINSNKINDAVLDSALIKVPGTTIIIKNDDEYLSANYPNPFDYETNFDLILAEKTSLEFKIYELDTRNILNYKDIQGQIKIFKIDDGSYSDVSSHTSFEKGKYLIKFIPLNYDIASGQYLFVLQTDKNTHSRRMMYVK